MNLPLDSREVLSAMPVDSCESPPSDSPLTRSGDDRHPVDVLADEFSARLRAGEKPSIEEYELRSPEHRVLIRSLFPTIAMMERMTQQASRYQELKPRTQVRQKILGDFQIVREIGRGGMGVVYEAIQRSLERKVALKVLGSGISSSPHQLQRFRREAESAARLHHTNIVPVYGIGEEDDIHFYAMQFIDGIPLADAIKTASRRSPGSHPSDGHQKRTIGHYTKLIGIESSSDGPRGEPEVPNCDRTLIMKAGCDEDAPNDSSRRGDDFDNVDMEKASDISGINDPPRLRDLGNVPEQPQWAFTDFFDARNSTEYFRQIAFLGAQVADALDYAHRHGVLHRDIKPSNLMLDRNGSVWIMDFGLVKVLERDDITQVGEIVGTLRYMAPEQLEGRADARTDVYGLGLTLFELLTFRAAFEGDQQVTLAQRLQQEGIPRLCSINPLIPRDLETIILKAASRDPESRYLSAAKLAEDLRRFHDDHPILARRVTSWERFVRWSRRNPALAAATGSIIVLLGLIAVITSIGRLNVESALHEAKNAQLRSESNLDSAINAFDSILDNVTSRGLPRSLAFNIPQAEVGLTQTPLSTADALLLDRLLRFYRTLASQNGGNLRLRARIALAHQRAGAILVRLGRLNEAEQDLRTAVGLQNAILKTDPRNIEALVNAAAIYNEIGELLLRRGQFRETFISHLEALALILEQPEVVRSNPAVRFEFARATDLFASIDVRSGTNEGPTNPPNHGSRRNPVPLDGANVAGRRRLVGAAGAPSSAYQTYSSPSAKDNRQPVPPGESDRFGVNQADERLRKARPAAFVANHSPIVGLSLVLLDASNEFRSLVNEFPDNAEYPFRLAQCLRHRLVHAASGNEPDVARETFLEAVQILDRLATKFPNEPKYLFELGDTLTQASRAQSGDDVTKSLERSVEISEELSTRFPTVSEYQLLFGTALARRAAVQAAGSPADAEASLTRSIKILELLANHFPDQGVIQIPLAKSCQQMGDLLRVPTAGQSDAQRLHTSQLNDSEDERAFDRERLERSRNVLQSAIDRFGKYLLAAEAASANQRAGHFNAQTLANLYASLAETLTQLRLPEQAEQAHKKAITPRRPPPPR